MTCNRMSNQLPKYELRFNHETQLRSCFKWKTSMTEIWSKLVVLVKYLNASMNSIQLGVKQRWTSEQEQAVVP